MIFGRRCGKTHAIVGLLRALDDRAGQRGSLTRHELALLGMLARPAVIIPTDAELERYGGLDYRPVGHLPMQYDSTRRLWLDVKTLQEVGPASDDTYWLAGWDPAVAGRDAYYASFNYASSFGVVKKSAPAKPPPQTVMQGEIIAYRAWGYESWIESDGSLRVCLTSPYYSTAWEGPVMLADQTPTLQNESGLYAVGVEPRHEANWAEMECQVWGRVALSGTVIEGENGYRAERLTIQELFVNPKAFTDGGDNPAGLAVHLAKRYQCDVSLRLPVWREVASDPDYKRLAAGNLNEGV